jgi:hypothetical protein
LGLDLAFQDSRPIIVALVTGFRLGLGVLGTEASVIRRSAASACPSMQWA